MQNTKELLATVSHPLLKGVNTELLGALMDFDQCHILTYRSGDVIFSPQSSSPGLGILLDGTAVAHTAHSVKKVMLRTFSPGAVFGISDWYNEEQPFFSRIEAHTQVRLLLIKPSAVRRLLDESPAFREQYIRFLTDRIRFLNQKIGYLTAGSAEYKLSHYLLSLGERETVTLPLAMSGLAEMLDLGRASLYRAFDTLVEDGFISKQGKTITLHDREGMAEYYHQKAHQ
ncbi:MAG: Crp/Fnr family transcriptional regulator [Clostridia bacterium]|nr:Crp/Fnr family transcriptional regulator [Clostridia bacterium]